MLLSLAASGKSPSGILATTFCEEKQALKERLTGILNDKKRPARTAALTLALALLLTGCAAMLGASGGTGGKAPRRDPGVYEKQPEPTDGQTQNLQALNAKDRYIDGKIYEDVPEEFADSFPDKAAAAAVPDGRKGERAGSLLERDQTVLFLNSIPEKNIYLYGYNDTEHPFYGLILDIGEEQHIYAFPYLYTTAAALAPEVSASEDGSRIYVCCRTGSGTGVSLSQLYVFQVVSGAVSPYCVDLCDLIALINSKITISYDGKSGLATVCAGGRQLAEESLITVGAEEGTHVAPDSFYFGNQIRFHLVGDSVKVSCAPTLYSLEHPGAEIYLENLDSLDTEISFTYGRRRKYRRLRNRRGIGKQQAHCGRRF
jgi:hypothetical protein